MEPAEPPRVAQMLVFTGWAASFLLRGPPQASQPSRAGHG